jgi:hypothetical protein
MTSPYGISIQSEFTVTESSEKNTSLGILEALLATTSTLMKTAHLADPNT